MNCSRKFCLDNRHLGHVADQLSGVIGKQQILPILFSKIVILGAVLRELQAAATPPEVRRWMASRPGWLRVKEPARPPEPSLSHLDAGEREAIQLAEELKADLLIIDERAGREEALKRSLPVIGTLAILESAAERGLLDVALVLAELKAHNFFISPVLERDFLERDAQRKARAKRRRK